MKRHSDEKYAFAPTPSNLGIFAVNFKREGIQ